MSFNQIISTAIATLLIPFSANAFFQGGLLFCTVVDNAEAPNTTFSHLITVVRENDQTPDAAKSATLNVSGFLNNGSQTNASSDIEIEDILNNPEVSVGDFSEFSTLSVSEVPHSN